MKLVWIYGPPAAGKLTVATCLKEQFGYKLFHNHLAVDIGLAIYDRFGEKDFLSFTKQVRQLALAKAKEIGVSHLVMTHMACADHDREIMEDYLAFFLSQGMQTYPVHLQPSRSALLERAISDARKASHKLSDSKKVAALLDKQPFAAIEHENGLVIDNTELTAEQVAGVIHRHVD